MNLAQVERQAICDTLLRVGPDAPTLCGAWTTHDLAAHLWVRENELPAMANLLLSRSRQAAMRIAAVRAKHPFDELVADLRAGPARLSPFRLSALDERANRLEFFVHHEDVRRAGPSPLPPREPDPEVEDELWAVVKQTAPALFRKSPFGVDLLTPDGRILAVRRRRRLTVVGPPGELLLWACGRTGVAQVRLQGAPGDVARIVDGLGI